MHPREGPDASASRVESRSHCEHSLPSLVPKPTTAMSGCSNQANAVNNALHACKSESSTTLTLRYESYMCARSQPFP